MSRPLAFAAIIILIILGIYFIYPEIFLSLEVIKAFHKKWVLLYQTSPFEVVSIFMSFNIVMAMLPVPGISMISFLGGAIFGFIPGLFYSSIATALGNLGGFFLGRYFIREWVMKTYGHKVKMFDLDWQKRGAMALYSFRLFPFIPSFVANLMMGVSPLHWWTFFWVSWVGRIPMVLIYTYAGVQVASINNIAEIMRPSLLIALNLLAILPWGLKSILNKRPTKK